MLRALRPCLVHVRHDLVLHEAGHLDSHLGLRDGRQRRRSGLTSVGQPDASNGGTSSSVVAAMSWPTRTTATRAKAIWCSRPICSARSAETGPYTSKIRRSSSVPSDDTLPPRVTSHSSNVIVTLVVSPTDASVVVCGR